MPRSRAAALVLTAFAPVLMIVLVPVFATSCDRGQTPGSAPFPGARPLELACLKENRAPTVAELEKIVGALVEVAGGDLALRKLSFRRVEDLYLRHSPDPQSNQVRVSTWVRPDQTIRTMLEYRSGQSEQRVLFRGQEYLSALGQPLQAAIGANKQYVDWDWQVARLPHWLTEAGSLTPLPLRQENGRTLVAMHVEVETWSPTFDCLIDPAGPMIVALEAELPLTGDLVAHTRVRQRIDLSDFRRVDGLLFPFRREVSKNGSRFALIETRTIETNVSLPDELFKVE